MACVYVYICNVNYNIVSHSYSITLLFEKLQQIVIVYLNLVKFKFDIGLIYPGITRVLILGSAFLYFLRYTTKDYRRLQI